MAGWLRMRARSLEGPVGLGQGQTRDFHGPIQDVATAAGAFTVYQRMQQPTLLALPSL